MHFGPSNDFTRKIVCRRAERKQVLPLGRSLRFLVGGQKNWRAGLEPLVELRNAAQAAVVLLRKVKVVRNPTYVVTPPVIAIVVDTLERSPAHIAILDEWAKTWEMGYGRVGLGVTPQP